MPFYHCLTPSGVLQQAQKREIVEEITRIHCSMTGGLPEFVQVQFEEIEKDNVFQNREPSSALRLHARIRAGRDAACKRSMLSAYTALLSRVAGVPESDVMVAFVETSFENVMEGGRLLPPPGEEAEWR